MRFAAVVVGVLVALAFASAARAFTFDGPLQYPAANASNVALGDFNGDGLTDLAVGTTDGHVLIYQQSPARTFTQTLSLATGSGGPVRGVVTGDFNHDGKLDVAAIEDDNGSGQLHIHYGDGSGSFPGSFNFALTQSPVAIVAGDFNGDGTTDIAVAEKAGTTNEVLNFPDNGQETMAPMVGIQLGGAPVAMVAGNFNGDSTTDYAVLYASGGTTVIDPEVGLPALVPFSTSGGNTALVAGDFDGDGRTDLAIANGTAANVTILNGDGSGNFSATAPAFPVAAGTNAIAAADFDADGKLDYVTTSPSGVQFAQNAGSLAFTGGGTFSISGASAVAAGGVDADGRPDAMVVGPGTVFGLYGAVPPSTPPANTSPPTISGALEVGFVLTADPGTWSNNPTSYAYQWERDGTDIAGATSSTYRIHVADAGHHILVKVAAKNVVGPGTAAVSAQTAAVPALPVNGSLAWSQYDTGNYDIWTRSPGGSPLHVGPGGGACESKEPSWDPTGTKIAFASNCGPSTDQIFTMNADGSSVTEVTGFTGAADWPAWSPSGTKLAYIATDDGGGGQDNAGQVIVSNPDGSSQSPLTTSLQGEFVQPAWSPDGSEIAVVNETNPADPAANASIQIYDTATGVLLSTPVPAAQGVRHPHFNADGSELYYDVNDTQIYAYSFDTGTSTPIPAGGNQERQAVPSPDGTQIAWLHNGDVVTGTEANGANAGTFTNISNSGVAADPAWGALTVPPPTITLTSTPPNPSSLVDVEFAYTVSSSTATTTCQLDSGPVVNGCKHVLGYTGLALGTHTLTLQATDSNVQGPVASYTWTVQAPPPASTAGTNERVSVDSEGSQFSSGGSMPSMSADGNLVAFQTNTPEVNDGGHYMILVRNRAGGGTKVLGVSPSPAAPTPDGDSTSPSMAPDGSKVAFQSTATNIAVAAEPNGALSDIFVAPADGSAGATRISASPTASAQDPSISDANALGANRVAFDTAGADFTTLTPNGSPFSDTNGVKDVYVFQTGGSGFIVVSTPNSSNANANGPSTNPSISADGSAVAYQSTATNLVATDTNGVSDVFVRPQIFKPNTFLVSHTFAGGSSNGPSFKPSISDDGNEIAFLSTATNLVPGGSPAGTHAFLTNRHTGTVVEVDTNSDGTPMNDVVNSVSISRDGTKVFFASHPQVPPGAAPVADQAYEYDVATGATSLVSLANGGKGNSITSSVAANGDGTHVAFQSLASNLVSGDTNGAVDVFVRNIGAGTAPTIQSVTAQLTQDETSVQPPTQVHIDNIPVAAVTGSTTSSTSGAPVAQIPVAQIPVAQIPVAQIDLATAPVAQIPVAQIGLGDPNLASALATVPITQIPLRSPLSWTSVLANTTLAAEPQQSITLEDVLSLSPLPDAFTGANGTPQLKLSDIDFSHSTLGTVPIVAWALGGATLSQLPLPGSTDATSGWCTALGLTSCPSSLGSQTVLAESVAGAPVAQIPVAQIPVAQIPVAQIPVAQIPVAQIGAQTWASAPVAQIPVAQINLAGSPVAQIPVAQIAVAGSPVAQIPVAQIAANSTPVAQIPVAQIPVAQIGNILDCSNPTNFDCNAAGATLGQALAAGAILPGATLGMLGTALNGITFGDIAAAIASSKLADIPLTAFGRLTIGDLIAVLPNTVTLGDILQLLVGTQSIAWEQLPYDKNGMQEFAADGGVLHMHAHFQLSGSPATGQTDARVTVTLPVGAVYSPGSSTLDTGSGSTALDDPTVTSSPVPSPNGVPQQTLVWAVPDVQLGDADVIDFKAYPPLQLGVTSTSESAQATTGGPTSSTATQPVTVVDPETTIPNNDPSTAPTISPNDVEFGYITTSTDTDYYRIAAPPPGTRIVVRLGHLGTDDDLVVYSPSNSNLRATGLSGQPLDGTPITDQGISVNNQNTSVAPQVTGDVPIASGLAVAGVSDNTGTTPDQVTTTSTTSTGYYTIQVSGYNGATSNQPYTIHVEEIAAPPAPSCPARTFPHAGEGVASTATATVPSNANTLFVFDKKRFGDTYGATAAQNVQDALAGLSSQTTLGVSGAVVDVEAYPGVQAAYDAWDASPCDPNAANGVASAIAHVEDGIRASHPSIRYVVNVGGDDIVPFFRLPDNTTLTNESGYAGTFGPNEYFGAAYNSDFLSDDPYATTAPIPFLDRQMFVPDLVVSRLVETPAQITQAVSQYESASGELTPSNAYVAGYDFLADGSHAVASALSHDVTGGVTTRIDEFGTTAATAWTKTQLLQDLGLLGSSTPAWILAPNAHYDHSRLLTSKGGAEELASPPGTPPDPAELASTQDVLNALATAPSLLRGRIIFTMGCHAGLAVSDPVVQATEPGGGTTATDDWAQTYAGAGAIYVANTGFGIGDTATVAYSEELMALLAQHLDGTAHIGEALSMAKEDYFAGLGAVSVYDEKAMNEAELYGLPMWSVGVPQTAVAASATVRLNTTRSIASVPTLGQLGLDPQTGLNAASFSADPTFTKFSTSRGDYYSNSATAGDFTGYQATNYRPIEPKTTLQLPASNDFRGVLLLHVTSADEHPWTPAIERPTFDDSATEPALSFASDSWPSKIGTVTTERALGARRQQLELVTGAFFNDTTLAADGTSVQRRWTHLDGDVFYNDSSSDFTPPTIQQTTATALDSTHVAFSVRAYDTNGSTTATTDPKLVYVLYRDSSTNVWKGVFLQQGAPGGPWTGGAAVGSTQIEYFVQSCDNAGNCSSTSDKARFFGAITQPNASQGGVTISAAGQSGANGWYTGAVTLTAADTAQNVVLNATVDGGAPQAIANGGTITLSTSGVHTVEVDASDGGSAVKTVAIDVDNPKISFTVPADQATYPIGASVTVAYSCSDVGSGIQSCAGTQASGAALDTSTPGFHTFTVTATDNAGLTATATHTYQVLWPFNGFFDPVANTPTLNVIKVGQAVPVKFSLGANRGLSIFLPGYPATESINCLTDVASDPILQTVTAGSSSLTYDATSNQYTYVWKTPSSGWASGTCRQLVLGLLDKSVHVAYFKAK